MPKAKSFLTTYTAHGLLSCQCDHGRPLGHLYLADEKNVSELLYLHQLIFSAIVFKIYWLRAHGVLYYICTTFHVPRPN